jgi:S1-C subfamily serine protease
VTALPEALKAQLDVDGLLITSVDACGRGAAAGLQAHDVVLKIDGAPVGTPAAFRAAVRKAGSAAIRLDLLRRGKPTTVTVQGDAS